MHGVSHACMDAYVTLLWRRYWNDPGVLSVGLPSYLEPCPLAQVLERP